MKKKLSWKGLWEILKDSSNGFSDDKIAKLSASLAFYTLFSLGPLLIMIIYLCGLFFGREAVQGNIYHQIEGFVGHDVALQLQEIIKNAAISGKGRIAAIIGLITLLIGATSVFAEIQDSINMIWGLKPKPKTGFIKFVLTRVLSFGVIAGLGFLLIVSLSVTALVEALSDHLHKIFPDITVIVFYIINLIITFSVITILFGVIFKVLPDAKIKWKDVLAGSVATAVLFMFGKFAISLYISKSNVGSTYGTAGSLVILLLWIYYSSFILYFGAEFTKSYAVRFGSEIIPNQYAVTTQTLEVETGKKSVQQSQKAAPVIEAKAKT
ncbi:MAG TPA: YihY/virulence factor BrkB family protein [Flavisolibacter sp.]|nr:YihY/virulence factor BrkB family protein [Flavisolibacter sp.]